MHTHVGRTHAEIPEKVPSAETLDHSYRARVAPYSLHGAHSSSFLVKIHNAKGEGGYESRLEEGNDMDVPIIFRSGREGGVGLGE